MKSINKKGVSIIGILILGLILFLVLSYFKINIKSVVESEETRENIEYVKGKTKNLWDDYLEKPASYLWKNIFVDIFWNFFSDNIERIKDSQSKPVI